MKVIAIVPARMAATRFPGKPLVDICGLPMIEHVRRRVALCTVIDEVIVATCDQEIVQVVQDFGGIAVMTANEHERCTDRVAEASISVNADIVINVQGDEPLVNPQMFYPLLEPFKEDPDTICTNLMAEIETDEDFQNSDVVKTVFDMKQNALYFSREAIPSLQKAGSSAFKKFKQLGVIAFRQKFLQQFAKLPPTPLEVIESVDMMRAIEHGFSVRMVESYFDSFGVDRPKDLKRVAALMKKDALFGQY